MAESYVVTNGTVALVASTAKTVVEIVAGSSKPFRITEINVTQDASTPTAGTKVELTHFATTGTGTSATLQKENGEANNVVAQSTAKINDSVEPASQTAYRTWYVPNTGGLVIQFPLGREHYCATSSGIGIRCTSASGSTPNIAVNVAIEE